MSTTELKLTELLTIPNPDQFKLHLSAPSEDEHPLNAYVRDRDAWHGWNRWRDPRKNDWTRPYIFSFIEFYPVAGTYLFGGAFEVLERRSDGYEIQELEEYAKWEGRLVCSFYRYQGMRGRAFYLENYLDQFTVHQVLPHRYDGESFCGYENINHRFSELKPLLQAEKADWKASLKAVKGVYLIMDTATGKSYVGSAYGGHGIWSRLQCYIHTGHGWNDDLVRTIKEKGDDYAERNFKFSVLEIFTFNTADELILARESHWKRVMLSRQFGYNKN